MRGYFGIGVERVSKARNVGALFRTAHAFDASFVFTVAAAYGRSEGGKADTSDSLGHVPFYDFPDGPSMMLPKGCQLVGVELLEDAHELPSFHHPPCAAYILGPERASLSPEIVARCDHILKIPTRFCLNVSIAGAIVMYDRILSQGRFARRPHRPGGPAESLEKPVFGDPVFRTKTNKFLAAPPLDGIPSEE